jgi:hypothetical protein
MATKVWSSSPSDPCSKGSKPRHTPVGLSHRDATSNSTTKGRLTTGEIGVFAFTLSLILPGMFLAAYSDRPVFLAISRTWAYSDRIHSHSIPPARIW